MDSKFAAKLCVEMMLKNYKKANDGSDDVQAMGRYHSKRFVSRLHVVAAAVFNN